jgi:hypothetical protein
MSVDIARLFSSPDQETLKCPPSADPSTYGQFSPKNVSSRIFALVAMTATVQLESFQKALIPDLYRKQS